MTSCQGFTANRCLRAEAVEAADVRMNPGSVRPFPVVEIGNFTLMPSTGNDLASLLRRLASMVDDLVSASASSCIWEGDPEHDRCVSCTAGFPEDCDRYPAAETTDIDTQEVA